MLSEKENELINELIKGLIGNKETRLKRALDFFEIRFEAHKEMVNSFGPVDEATGQSFKYLTDTYVYMIALVEAAITERFGKD